MGTIAKEKKISNDIEFVQKLSLCLHLLDAESDIISTVSSWRDTLPDEDVLGALDSWLDATLSEKQRSIQHVQKWHNKQ